MGMRPTADVRRARIVFVVPIDTDDAFVVARFSLRNSFQFHASQTLKMSNIGINALNRHGSRVFPEYFILVAVREVVWNDVLVLVCVPHIRPLVDVSNSRSAILALVAVIFDDHSW